MISRSGLAIEPEDAGAVVKLIARGRRLDGFGNAGAVETILGRAKLNKATRLSQADADAQVAAKQGLPYLRPDPDFLLLSDFTSDQSSLDLARKAFDDLDNNKHMKTLISSIECTLELATSEGKSAADILSNHHMVFAGPVRERLYIYILYRIYN